MADGPERYTISPADVDGCRAILARLEGHDRTCGGYAVGSIQGYPASAQAVVRFDRSPGAMVTSEALATMLDAPERLALVCKKVIAHFDTHGHPADTEAAG